MTSCVKDEGVNELMPINEIEISGMQDSYSKLSNLETLNISMDVKCSDLNFDNNQLEYSWVLCFDESSDSNKRIQISREKDLNYFVDVAPGTYSLYFIVKDNVTGIKWEKTCILNVGTLFSRGFYLFGDKEDGRCGMDFVSMLENRDVTIVHDIFKNSVDMRGAKNLIFTGNYYKEQNVMLWAVSESDSYSLDWSSALTTLDVNSNVTAEKILFPTIPVANPMKIIDILPHSFGSSNKSTNGSSRIIMTENEFFSGSIISVQAFGNPKNRYSSSSTELFQPAPYLFYKGSASYVSYVMLYDKDKECFVVLNSSYSFGSYFKKVTNDSATPFYFDQSMYTPVRTLVYGENGYGNAGRSYALMNNKNGDYYVYRFFVGSTSPSRFAADQIDLSVATDFSKASSYAFYSMQPIILYSVGSKLWAYDYNRKECKLVKDFESQITYLAMDFNSNDNPDDFIVATYSSAEKGIVRRFSIKDDANNISISAYDDIWKTDLKVKKVEYKNCNL